MKAEDTVMTHEIMMAEIWDLGFGIEGSEGRPPTQKERFERIAKSQAAISFPLGEKQGYEKGINEVVKWIKANANLERGDRDVGLCFEDYLHFDYHDWQAFLKEREINAEAK